MLFVISDVILTESPLVTLEFWHLTVNRLVLPGEINKDDNKSKVMTLDASEFTRRFLMHVLPNRFVKIRHYGILCSRNIRSKLFKCMKLTGNKPLHLNVKQKDVKVCRSCGSADVITTLVPYSFATASSA